MILGSVQLPVVMLDGSVGAFMIALQVLAGLAALAFSWFVGLLVSLRLAVDIKPSIRLEILCVVLAVVHVAASIKLKDLSLTNLDVFELLARISLIVVSLVLSDVLIGRIRRRRRRS